MNSIQTHLMEEIDDRLNDLKDVDMTSKEYETAVNGVAKLFDKAIEMEKLNIEQEKNEKENEFKIQQMEGEKKDRVWKNILTGAGIVIPTLVTIWGTKASFRFEKDDTITTIMGRGFIQKLLPKK